MEGKFVVYFFLILAMLGAGYGIYHTTEIDDANKELIDASSQIGSLEDLVRKQKAYIELRQEAVALLTASGIMQKEVSALRNEIAQHRQAQVAARKDFDQAIAVSRSQSAGLVLEDPVLPSGVRLRNARVEKVEGDITTISHSEGISKIGPEMLPKELKDRFRFGMAMGSEEAVEAPSIPVATAPSSSTNAPQMSTEDQLVTARQELEKMKKELPYLEAELAKVEAESAAATSPSKRFYIKNRLDSLNKQIADLKTQMLTAEADVKKLQ
ncbi:MAG: hypothetical protein V4599_14070 [Verrucomicrobiota bacterium]